MTESYDLVVIGSGAAAQAAAKRASGDFGATVALVDRGEWGGACALVACKPTKAYVEAARLGRDLRVMGESFGLDPSGTVSLSAVKAWKDELVGTPQRFKQRFEESGWAVVEGTASFVNARTLKVGDRELIAERILIASGSKPAVPPIEGLADTPWLDNVRALELTEVPEALLVIGAGPVGLELGQFFARLGSKVTIVGRGFAGRADAEAAAVLREALVSEGIDVRDETVASLDNYEFSHVLLAAGRVPDLDDLALDRAGVERNARGVVVDEHMRSSVDGIWAAGDAAGRYQLTSVGDYEAKVAVDDMYTDAAPVADYSALPACIFTDPELGDIGLSEEQARAEGHAVETVSAPIENMLRPYYTDSTTGVFKLVYDGRTRRVLGIHIVARGAGEIVQGYAPALKLGLTMEDLVDTHYVYPSYGEGVRETAELAVRAVVRGVSVISRG